MLARFIWAFTAYISYLKNVSNLIQTPKSFAENIAQSQYTTDI